MPAPHQGFLVGRRAMLAQLYRDYRLGHPLAHRCRLEQWCRPGPSPVAFLARLP